MPDVFATAAYRALLERALAEDIGTGDVTTEAIVPASLTTTGVFLAKSPLVVAGLGVARDVLRTVGADVVFDPLVADGDRVERGTRLARVAGCARDLLTGERTALNFLQHLSGVATLTRAYVEAAAGRIAILDTRKTVPGLRDLAKYAVRCGGGRNHRMGLFDGILIKDNHIRVAGGVAEAVARVRRAAVSLPIEIEVQSLADVDAALEAQVEVVMLDNLDAMDTAEAIRRIGNRAQIELSGNMTRERVTALAPSGAHFISVGALTHSAPAADISLELAL
jgi:nicotinate-nucleotide pyrophosphorylase (carboxylating)